LITTENSPQSVTQQHGVMALMSVFGSILFDSDQYSGLFAEHALGRKAVFPGVQGDTPAMAEMQEEWN
jgi:metal-dependent hydrolase (beta-lactamase superfamily II)